MATKKQTKWTIFSNEINDEVLNYAKEEIVGWRKDWYGEKDITINDISEEDAYKKAYELNDLFFEDEMVNLNKRLDYQIVAIVDMGLWSRRCNGYKVLGNNLNNIFDIAKNYDEIEFFCDKQNLCANLSHHDGTHYVTFRLATKVDAITLGEKWANKEIEFGDLYKYSRSLRGEVADIYGWQ